MSLWVRLCAPWEATVAVRVSSEARGADVRAALTPWLGHADVRLTTRGGQPVYAHSHVVGDMDLVVRARFCGGKGGFGNMLRAQGGRMSARGKHESQDSCRDLQGRRVGSVKQAQLLAEYVAQASERQAAWDEAQKRKYAKLERMLGRAPKSMADYEAAAEKLDEAGETLEEEGAQPSSSKRERLDDHDYVEQSREIVDHVRGAVASAMRKKRRKGKERAA